MTIKVSVEEASVNFPELIRRVREGEDIAILEGSQEVAYMVPSAKLLEPRIPGIDEGKVIFAPDVDDPLPKEILEGFRD